MPDPLIPDYRPAEHARPVVPPGPGPRFDLAGLMSLVFFAGVLLCFVGGLAGLYFDPSVKKEWGGLGYLFLMTLLVMFCPVGLLLGLVGLLDRPAPLSAAGVFCNGAALLAFLLWRLA